MKIALISWQEKVISQKARDEISALGAHLAQEHEVINVLGPDDLSTDFQAALMRTPDYIDGSRAEEVAWKIWDGGVSFLVDPLSRRLARNKLYSHRLFAEHGIRQPRWSLDPNDLSGEVIRKPLCGGRSVGVTWHKEPPGVNGGEPFLFQEYREPLALWRSIASPKGVVLAYKKVSKEKIISVSSGADREILPAPKELEEISQKMARAFGGGLWGLDVIEDQEGFWALEANMNFGYPLEYAGSIVEEISAILKEKSGLQ